VSGLFPRGSAIDEAAMAAACLAALAADRHQDAALSLPGRGRRSDCRRRTRGV